jgi:hypothetical protein
MPHNLKLAFKDAPLATDDMVNLNQLSANPSTNPTGSVGIELISYSEGEIQNGYQELSLVLNIEGTSRDDVIARYRQIKRYGQRTRMYFKRFSGDDDDPTTPVKLPLGNIPARLDGLWQQGSAAVLTFKADWATKEVYWNVVDYRLSEPDYSLVNSQYSFNGVNLTLIVQAGARGTRVILDNIIHGDYCPPFTLTGTPQTCGYTMGGAAWTQETSTFGGITPNRALFGNFMLQVQNSATTTTSTESQDYVTGDILIPGIYGGGVVGSGSIIIKFQGWNGAAWVDIQTIATITASVGVWTPYQGTAYTANTATHSKVRLSLTGSASCRFYFDGGFIWRNPVGSVLPTEYVSPGKVVNAPAFNVYNVQGDIPAPMQLWQGLAKSNVSNQSIFVAGSVDFDPSFENLIENMCFVTANGTLDSTMFFGRVGLFSSGAGTSSSYAFYSSAAARTVDYRSRIYRAFLVYAANDSSTITAVTLNAAGLQKTFTVALPQTYAGNLDATASQYRIYDLGDFFMRRPGTAWEETTTTIGSGTSVTLTHSSNANRHTAVAGVILLPARQFGTVDMITPLTQLLVTTYSEAGAPVAGYSTITTSTIPVQEISGPGLAGTLTGGDFMLMPNANPNVYTCQRFDVLVLTDRDSTYSNLYTFDASGTTHTALRYAPRYSSGVQ